jgi:hypothetical protein
MGNDEAFTFFIIHGIAINPQGLLKPFSCDLRSVGEQSWIIVLAKYLFCDIVCINADAEVNCFGTSWGRGVHGIMQREVQSFKLCLKPLDAEVIRNLKFLAGIGEALQVTCGGHDHYLKPLYVNPGGRKVKPKFVQLNVFFFIEKTRCINESIWVSALKRISSIVAVDGVGDPNLVETPRSNFLDGYCIFSAPGRFIAMVEVGGCVLVLGSIEHPSIEGFTDWAKTMHSSLRFDSKFSVIFGDLPTPANYPIDRCEFGSSDLRQKLDEGNSKTVELVWDGAGSNT